MKRNWFSVQKITTLECLIIAACARVQLSDQLLALDM